MYGHTNTCEWLFLAVLFLIAKKIETNKISLDWQMVKQTDKYIPWNASQYLKGNIIDICNNWGVSQRHYAK